MIDPTQLPILLKAIDFVFEEGRKILEERRERRKKQDQLPAGEEKSSQQEIVPLAPEKAVEIKQDLLASSLDEILWHNNEQELQHLVRLYGTYTHNCYHAREHSVVEQSRRMQNPR